MALVSWISAARHHWSAALNKLRRQPRPQPTHSRPSLEPLEQRTLLDASSGLYGGINNLAFNGAQASNGVTLPIPTNGFHAVADNGTSDLAATADLLAQDQPNSQFRLFGINSQGESFRFFQQITANILHDAYGFGSGTWPNRPWMPAAYNVGLANHQFAYSSQADHGFSSVPPNAYPQPGTIPIAQAQPKTQKQRLDEENQKTDENPEPVLVRKPTLEQEEAPQNRLDENLLDRREDAKALLEQSAPDKKQPADQVLERDVSLPNSLWLSVLAPAPVTALVAGLPGAAAEAEDGDIGAAAE